MKRINVSVSPKQLWKLRKGHRVRIRKHHIGAEGIGLIVNPEKYDIMTRTFAKGKALDINLDDEELEANEDAEEVEDGDEDITGGALFGKQLKKLGIKKVATQIGDMAKAKGKKLAVDLAKKGLDYGAKYAMDATTSYLAGEGLSSEFPNKTGLRMKAVKNLAGRVAENNELSKLGRHVGANYGSAFNASIGNIEAHKAQSGLIENAINKKGINGFGLRREVGSVGRGGSLVGANHYLPPALQSQPFGANFQFNSTLPVQYQMHRQNGIYEHVGMGLYA